MQPAVTSRCQCPRYTTGDVCQNIMRGELINATYCDQQMPVSEVYNWRSLPEHNESLVNFFLNLYVPEYGTGDLCQNIMRGEFIDS